MRDGYITVTVRDTGTGFPPGLDPARATSLGLRIVHLLAQRLNATVAMETRGGACVTARIPVQSAP
jgi:two-component sensor histidine kinase